MSNMVAKHIELCKKCNKPLQNTVCVNCGGKGYTRELLFVKRECETCQGRGWYLRCPDAAQHALDELRASQKSYLRPTTSFSSNKTSRSSLLNSTKIPPTLPKKPQVPPPWLQPNNPMNPNSIFNPNNPLNPNSLRNPNNPLNPNSLRNPNNPASPLYRKPFKK